MKKKIIVVFFLLVFLVQTSPTLAYETDSNTVITRVGNPSGTVNSNPSTGVLKSAEDMKHAFDTCSAGLTVQKTGLDQCLGDQLTHEGYDADTVKLFEQRYPGTLVYEPTYGAICTQCLGFVALSLLLYSGDASALTQGNASDVLNEDSFTLSGTKGTFTFKKVSGPPQAGDIGVSAASNHILFVYQTLGTDAFVSVESNGGDSCAISDTRQRLTANFTAFYRMQ